MINNQETRKQWWGDFSVPLGGTIHFVIGAFSLHLLRREKEWLISQQQNDEAGVNEETWSVTTDLGVDFDEGDTKRHIFKQTSERLKILPRLADRPVVVNTTKPLHIQPGHYIDLFVSTPLWYSVKVGPEELELQEGPILRPSDTWFGPSTMQGELCYASTTQGRLSLAELTERPHRATSAVKIDNQTGKALVLNQLSLPAPYLSLFDIGNGSLWTEQITLLNEDDSDLAKVTIADCVPVPYSDAWQICAARQTKQKNMILSTFSRLFN